jgi:hypothetical protein
MPYTAPYPKILLLGSTGTGKTYSIRTLVTAGLTPLVIFTEPGMEVLSDIPCPKLHYHYVPPMTLSWADMADNVRKVNTLSFEQLTKLSDPKRNTYTEMQDFVGSMGNFTCDRCGEKLGAIDALDPTRFAVVNDSLSGINLMAMNTVVGGKPLKNQGEWGLAMDLVEKYVNLFTTGLPCLGVIIAHIERETDEITGGSAVMVSTLGRKLAPRLPRFFSDVIQAKRDGAKFTWSTATFNVDLKARNLPIADNLPPDFGPLLAAFRLRSAK